MTYLPFRSVLRDSSVFWTSWELFITFERSFRLASDQDLCSVWFLTHELEQALKLLIWRRILLIRLWDHIFLFLFVSAHSLRLSLVWLHCCDRNESLKVLWERRVWTSWGIGVFGRIVVVCNCAIDRFDIFTWYRYIFLVDFWFGYFVVCHHFFHSLYSAFV